MFAMFALVFVPSGMITSREFHELFGGPPRNPENPLTQRRMDLAASVQKVTEEIMLRITRSLATTYQIENLYLAGGVALNYPSQTSWLDQNTLADLNQPEMSCSVALRNE
jgi:predicted NodU family carbamoyl transferase